jgi:hypothetical protein
VKLYTQPPQQAILFAPQYHRAIDSGKKVITIREGHRDYRLGFTIACCHHAKWARSIIVRSVTHTTLDAVQPVDLIEDGFSNHGQALEALRCFYPDLTPSSPVTIIRWQLPAVD